MYPLGFNDLSDSPVIILSPHQHQFDPITRAAHSLYRPQTKPVMDRRPYDMPLAKASTRKRGQDEVAREDISSNAQLVPTQTPTISPEEESSLPMRGSDIPVGNTNTFLEKDLATIRSDDEIACTGTQDPLETGHRRKVSRQQSAADVGDVGDLPSTASPVFTDEWTRILGIGWKSVEQSDESLAAAMRGNETFLRRHFGFRTAEIKAINQPRALFFVFADGNWCLFNEDLKEGRFISNDYQRAIENVRANPVRFDADIVFKVRDPSSISPKTAVIAGPSPPGAGNQAISSSPESDEGMFAGKMDVD